jgi:hypothetical protein
MGEEEQRVPVGTALRNAGFEAGDEWAKLAGCVDRPAGLSGDLGEAQGGLGELDHSGEVVGVVGGQAERCGGIASRSAMWASRRMSRIRRSPGTAVVLLSRAAAWQGLQRLSGCGG